MAQYDITVKIYETTEPIIRDSNDDFDSRVIELTQQSKINIIDRFYDNISYTGDFSDCQSHISKFLDLIRNRSQYPYITGTFSVVAV